MLWLLQRSAPSSMEQKVFPEDEPTGLQREIVCVQEVKSWEDLDDCVLTGSSARPRYLLFAALLEPSDGVSVFKGSEMLLHVHSLVLPQNNTCIYYTQ
jgi:hypothetical protein